MFMALKSPKKIGSLSKGSVHIVQGKVVAEKEVVIPGTSISCAAYWMMTEAWKRPARGKGRKMWIPVDVKQSNPGFFVEDSTGRVWIEHNDDALDIRKGREEGGRLGKKETSRFIARTIKNGDIIKIKGTIDNSNNKEVKDILVIRPDKKGLISIILKKRA